MGAIAKTIASAGDSWAGSHPWQRCRLRYIETASIPPRAIDHVTSTAGSSGCATSTQHIPTASPTPSPSPGPAPPGRPPPDPPPAGPPGVAGPPAAPPGHTRENTSVKQVRKHGGGQTATGENG